MHIDVQVHIGPSLGDVQGRSVGALGRCISVTVQCIGYIYYPLW